jgi:hypothetical protein
MNAWQLILSALDTFGLPIEAKLEILTHLSSEAVLDYVSDKCRIHNKLIDWEEFCTYLDKYVLNCIVIYMENKPHE